MKRYQQRRTCTDPSPNLAKKGKKETREKKNQEMRIGTRRRRKKGEEKHEGEIQSQSGGPRG